MESTLQKAALIAARTAPKARAVVYWVVTALFCLQMSFTAYAELRLPQVAEAFTHLGHLRAPGALVFLVAPPAGHAGAYITQDLSWSYK